MSARAHVLRITLRLAACVAMGTVATVLVAWTLALLGPAPALTKLGMAIDSSVAWQVNSGAAFGARRAEWASIIQRPPAWDDAAWQRLQDNDFPLLKQTPPPRRLSRDLPLDSSGRPRTRYEHSRGWPLPALWCEAAPASPTAWEGGIAFTRSTDPPPSAALGAFPCRINPRAFALDTAVFATIALALWPLPLLIRRRRRRVRSLCAVCGYNLSGTPSATCPECGT